MVPHDTDTRRCDWRSLSIIARLPKFGLVHSDHRAPSLEDVRVDTRIFFSPHSDFDLTGRLATLRLVEILVTPRTGAAVTQIALFTACRPSPGPFSCQTVTLVSNRSPTRAFALAP